MCKNDFLCGFLSFLCVLLAKCGDVERFMCLFDFIIIASFTLLTKNIF